MTIPECNAADIYAQILAAAAHEQDALAKLRTVIHMYCKLVGGRRSLVLTTPQEITGAQTRLRRFPLINEEAFAGRLTELIQQGMAEGLFRPVDAEMSARSLLGMLRAFVTFGVITEDSETSRDVADHVLRLFVWGVYGAERQP